MVCLYIACGNFVQFYGLSTIPELHHALAVASEQGDPQGTIARTTYHILAFGHDHRNGQIEFRHETIGRKNVVDGGPRIVRHVSYFVIEHHVIAGKLGFHPVQEFGFVGLYQETHGGVDTEKYLGHFYVLFITRQRDFRGLVVAPKKQYTCVFRLDFVFVLQSTYHVLNVDGRCKIPLDKRPKTGIIQMTIIHILLFNRQVCGANRRIPVAKFNRRRFTVLRMVYEIFRFVVYDGCNCGKMRPRVQIRGINVKRWYMILIKICQNVFQQHGSTRKKTGVMTDGEKCGLLRHTCIYV